MVQAAQALPVKPTANLLMLSEVRKFPGEGTHLQDVYPSLDDVVITRHLSRSWRKTRSFET